MIISAISLDSGKILLAKKPIIFFKLRFDFKITGKLYQSEVRAVLNIIYQYFLFYCVFTQFLFGIWPLILSTYLSSLTYYDQCDSCNMIRITNGKLPFLSTVSFSFLDLKTRYNTKLYISMISFFIYGRRRGKLFS